MSARFKITAESKPVYDKWGFWEGEYWKCAEWSEWFYALKSKYGKEKAIDIWGTAWNNQTNFASPIDCRSFDTTFIAFLKKEGLWEISTGGLGGLIPKSINVVSNIGEGIETSAKIIKYIVPVAVILGFIGVSAFIYKKYIK